MSRIQILPRDIRPGDKIDRVDRDLSVVSATIASVEKVRRLKSTAYRVTLTEFADLPDNRRPWAENRHLAPFLLFPRQKVTVEREVADGEEQSR